MKVKDCDGRGGPAFLDVDSREWRCLGSPSYGLLVYG